MSTIESLGIDISRLGPLPMCRIIIVSVRLPTSPPVPNRRLSSSLRSLRESLPTTRYVVPSCTPGRSPSGNASTVETLLKAKNGTAIRKASHSTRSRKIQRNRSEEHTSETPLTHTQPLLHFLLEYKT